MLRRWTFGLFVSVLAHVGVVAVGLALGARGFVGPVDVQLADFRVVELKDFPLGAPESGAGAKPRARARARSRAPEVTAPAGTLATRPGDETPQPGSSAAEDEAAPAPTNDLGAYGPAGSRLTVLMRLDRLRGTAYQAPVDGLLVHLPDRHDLLDGTGLDLFGDFDALLIATPNPRDPTVSFLAVRHHLDMGAMRAALGRGARATDRVVSWRREAGRLVGERRAIAGKGAAAPTRATDDRIVVLADPGLAVVTPPAYRALLLEPPHRATAGASGDAGPDADGGVSGSESGGPDGGAPPGWATLLARIDAEEGLMPPDGVVMLKAVDILRASAPASGGLPVVYGMEVPPEVSATIGVDDGPYLDVVAEFKSEAPARHWEAEWPALQRRLRTNPYVMVGAFSPLIARVTLTREGSMVRLHVNATSEEALRLLQIASTFAGRL
jgi:hypothetical protein